MLHQLSGSGTNLLFKMDSSQVPIQPANPISPIPFREIVGKHGRGLGRWTDGDNKPPIYFGTLIYQIQEEGLGHYFEVKPFIDENTGRKIPEHPKTTFRYGTPIVDKDVFLNNFTDNERSLLDVIANCISELSAEEIRAFGTHENTEKTISDICREFKYIEKSHKPNIIFCLNSNSCCLNDARNVLICTEEAYLKSSGNRVQYESAMNRFQDYLSTRSENFMLKVLGKCQAKAEVIWDDNTINLLAKLSRKARGMAKYLVGVAYYRNEPDRRQEVEDGSATEGSYHCQLWHEGIEEMEMEGIRKFQRSPNRVFNRAAKLIDDDTKGNFIALFENLPSEVEECLGNAKCKINI